MLDNHGRQVDYVRLAITDRCNLRCTYCMPERFSDFLPKADLLTYEELERLLNILHQLQIQKLRITGGEPFVRKNLTEFIERIAANHWFESIHLTTNGVLTAPFVPRLKAAGISGVNLSIDSLNRETFHRITRRDELPTVLKTLDALLKHEVPVKLNVVVIPEGNTHELVELARFTRENPVEVRFIEEMPFNGSGQPKPAEWTYHRILKHLSEHVDLRPLPSERAGTAMRYAIPGFVGTVGVIAAYSRTFCGTCNRLRISPKGDLKTCLYGRDVASVFDALRNHADDATLSTIIQKAIGTRHANGFEAEKELLKHDHHRSMVSIGG